jgi:hypothetical protein
VPEWLLPHAAPTSASTASTAASPVAMTGREVAWVERISWISFTRTGRDGRR